MLENKFLIHRKKNGSKVHFQPVSPLGDSHSFVVGVKTKNLTVVFWQTLCILVSVFLIALLCVQYFVLTGLVLICF